MANERSVGPCSQLPVQSIPDYLKAFISKQDLTLYTSIDHASWRFILKISQAFFSQHAHQKYLDGLKETGISMDHIPSIQEMDQCLRKFGWQAVPVVGFIPPSIFMEFLSLGVLPIACDMRTLDHLAYTPAPDIVHEAAGHAPIVADPEYSDYLRSYGEISRKAVFSAQDQEVYRAIRLLSDLKENPKSTDEDVLNAQNQLDLALQSVSYVSEATLLSRMGWWTFEYGLIGSLEDPKIFGAGLLSSLGESYHLYDLKIKKIKFSIDCIHTSYDITRPQPQLFVTPDFQTLKIALEDLASQMAFKVGGVEGLRKAKEAQAMTTTVLDSGVQVTGVLEDFFQDDLGRPCYLKLRGPVQISLGDRELEGQGPQFHPQGFGSPIEDLTVERLTEAGFGSGGRGVLRFESGISLEGKWIGSVHRNGRLVLATFEECTIKKGAEFLFRPEWGRFDLVCGFQVVSVFGGEADRQRYLEGTGGFKQNPVQQKTNRTDENRLLDSLYARVRKVRDSLVLDPIALTEVFDALEKNYPKDWLLRYELLELSTTFRLKMPWETSLRDQLRRMGQSSSEIAESIQRGLELLECFERSRKI